jgi:Flp pilus assembly protein TadG
MPRSIPILLCEGGHYLSEKIRMNSTEAFNDQTKRLSVTGGRLRASFACERGNAVLELALLCPLFLVLTVGAVEFARLTHTWIEVTNAARAGVAYGAQSRITAANAAGTQQAAMNDVANLSGVTVSTSRYCACANGTASTCKPTDCSASHIVQYLQVTASVTIDPLIYYWTSKKKTFTLTGTAVSRVRN